MIKDVYRIDKEGIHLDIYKIKTTENTYYNGEEWLDIDFNYVEVKPPYAKLVRWTGAEWEVIDEYPVEEILPQEPTIEEQQLEIINALGQELTMLKIQLIMGGVI